MGMVFQLSNLWPHLSVTENVAIAVRKVRGLPAREAKELALEMLAKVHMTHRAHDEPTSALDPELVHEVLKRPAGRTCRRPA